MSQQRTKRQIALSVLAIAGVLAVGYFIGTRTGSKSIPTNGAPVPAKEFTLSDVSGNDTRLSDYNGQVVLVDFWATWCLPCLQELPDLKRLYGKYGDEGFVILGISLDIQGRELVAPFVEKNEIAYPILVTNGEPPKGYEIIGLPTAFLINREGQIVKTYIGFKQPRELEADIKSLL